MGFTTFEAIAAIAECLRAGRLDVGYAGLKDEDAITEQFLTFRGMASGDDISEFNQRYGNTNASEGSNSHQPWMRLQLGYGNSPLSAGQLYGNSFRIVVRGLSRDQAQQLRDLPVRSSLRTAYTVTNPCGLPSRASNKSATNCSSSTSRTRSAPTPPPPARGSGSCTTLAVAR